MTRLEINYWWCRTKSNEASSYRYPAPVNEYIKAHYTMAGVYRWAVYGNQDEPVRAYIGEGENCAARLGQYLRGDKSQKQVFRIKSELLDPAITEGLRVEFHLLDFEPFVLNGVPFASKSLDSMFLRKFMEWFAIAINDHVHCELYNKISNRITRRRDKAVREIARMSESEMREELVRHRVEEVNKKNASSH